MSRPLGIARSTEVCSTCYRYRKSTLKSLSAYVKEHFANASYGVYPIDNDSRVAVIIVANKYSPNNFW